MRKAFPLEAPGHKRPRVIDSIKSDVRKYIKRERRKTLPEEVDFWDFDCRVGADSENAKTVHIAEIVAAIDVAAQEDGPVVYIEILAKPGHRTRKEPSPEDDKASPAEADSSDWEAP